MFAEATRDVVRGGFCLLDEMSIKVGLELHHLKHSVLES